MAEDEEISWLCERQIAAHGMRVEAPDRLRIGELQKGSVCVVFGPVWTWFHAEERGAEWGGRILILSYRFHCGRLRQRNRISPAAFVITQSLAIGEADQSGAVVNLSGARFGRFEVFGLGQPDEPAAEGFPIAAGVQTKEVGCAIAEGIVGIRNQCQVSAGRAMARRLKPDGENPWKNSATDPDFPSIGHSLDCSDDSSVTIAGYGNRGRSIIAGSNENSCGGGAVGR